MSETAFFMHPVGGKQAVQKVSAASTHAAVSKAGRKWLAPKAGFYSLSQARSRLRPLYFRTEHDKGSSEGNEDIY